MTSTLLFMHLSLLVSAVSAHDMHTQICMHVYEGAGPSLKDLVTKSSIPLGCTLLVAASGHVSAHNDKPSLPLHAVRVQAMRV